MKLRVHLMLLVLATLLPALVFSTWMLTRLAFDRRAQLEGSLLETSRALAVAVEKELERSMTMLQALTTSEYLDAGDFRRFYDQARWAQASQAWSTIYLVDAHGRQIINLDKPFGTTLPPLPDREPVRRVLKSRHREISGFVREPISGRPAIALAVPVTRGGAVRYVLVAGIEPSVLHDLVTWQGLPPNRLLCIVDAQGIFLARSRESERFVGQPAYAERARTPPDGVIRTKSPDGTDAYVASKRVKLSGWTVSFGVPTEEIDQPVRRALWSIGLVGFGLTLTGIAVALLLGGRVARGIGSAAGAAVALARGRRNPIPRSWVSEVTALSHALEDAAALIDQGQSEREQAERQREDVLVREQAARAEAERVAGQLRHLQTVTDTALSRLSFSELMQELLGRTRKALGADTAALLLLDDTGEFMHEVASDGLPADVGGDRAIAVGGETFAGEIAGSGKARIVTDSAQGTPGTASPSGHVKSLIGAPLKIDGRVIGVLHVGTMAAHRFSADDFHLLQLVAERVAASIDRGRAHQAEQAARQAAERALERLRAVQERFRRLVDANLIGVVLGNEDTIIGANHVFLTLTGYTQEDLEAGRIRWRAMIPREAVADTWMNELRATGECHPFEQEFIRRDGPRVAVLMGAALLASSPFEWVGFVLDITDRKQGENERAALLRDAQDARTAAEAANRSKDEFLAVLSHELRTPHNSILGWLGMLRSGELDGAATAHGFEVVERNVRHQIQLVDDLLDVSRIASGKFPLNVAPVDLVEVIEAAIDSLGQAALAKRIRVETNLEPVADRVAGDAARLQQVVANLVGNAIKFTPEGGRVTVDLQRLDGQARIRVSDTGMGISSALLPHVFDRFRQGDAGETRGHGGLGLGLSIVRHLVGRHGGAVHAESPGEHRGAAFTVELPLMEPAPSGAGPTATDLGSPRAEPARNLSGVRVLMVDDDEDTLDLFTLVLQRHGATVRAAPTVRDALAQLEEFRPQIVVSDISMPGEGGFHLIEALKQRVDEHAPVAAIALTAYSRNDVRERIMAAGFRLHLSKPVEPSELVDAVAALAAGREGGRRPD